MADDQQQLRLDLQELKHLEALAKRPRVQSLLSNEIRNLDAKIAKAASAPAAAAQAPVVQATAASSVLKYVALDKFSWDQDNDKIKGNYMNQLLCIGIYGGIPYAFT